MATVSAFPAVGKVLRIEEDAVIFQPLGTTYELRLRTGGPLQGSVGQRVQGMIRLAARKLYTVPSGGNFITPIFGPPRIVQGRIKSLDEKTLLLHAGTSILVDLPADDSAYDLSNGPLAPGVMVNIVALPGAQFIPAEQPAAV